MCVRRITDVDLRCDSVDIRTQLLQILTDTTNYLSWATLRIHNSDPSGGFG